MGRGLAAMAGKAGAWGAGGPAGAGAARGVGARVNVVPLGAVLLVGEGGGAADVEAVGCTEVVGTTGRSLVGDLGGTRGPLEAGGVGT